MTKIFALLLMTWFGLFMLAQEPAQTVQHTIAVWDRAAIKSVTLEATARFVCETKDDGQPDFKKCALVKGYLVDLDKGSFHYEVMHGR